VKYLLTLTREDDGAPVARWRLCSPCAEEDDGDDVPDDRSIVYAMAFGELRDAEDSTVHRAIVSPEAPVVGGRMAGPPFRNTSE
jgi:hypothetical protein